MTVMAKDGEESVRGLSFYELSRLLEAGR